MTQPRLSNVCSIVGDGQTGVKKNFAIPCGQNCDPLAVPLPHAHAAPLCFGQPATKVGTPQRDVITLTNNRDDVIVTMGGNDEIHLSGGHDLVCAGKGNDESRAVRKLTEDPAETFSIPLIASSEGRATTEPWAGT